MQVRNQKLSQKKGRYVQGSGPRNNTCTRMQARGYRSVIGTKQNTTNHLPRAQWAMGNLDVITCVLTLLVFLGTLSSKHFQIKDCWFCDCG